MAKRGRPKKEDPKEEKGQYDDLIDEIDQQNKPKIKRPDPAPKETDEPEESLLNLQELKNTTGEELSIISGVFTHIGRSREFNTELTNNTKDRPLKPLITLTEFNKSLSQFKTQET